MDTNKYNVMWDYREGLYNWEKKGNLSQRRQSKQSREIKTQLSSGFIIQQWAKQLSHRAPSILNWPNCIEICVLGYQHVPCKNFSKVPGLLLFFNWSIVGTQCYINFSYYLILPNLFNIFDRRFRIKNKNKIIKDKKICIM